MLLAFVLLFFGGVNLSLVIRCFRDEAFLREYVERSPKAALWRNMFGPVVATELTRRYFLPFGGIVSTAMVGLGLVILVTRLMGKG